MSGYFQRVPHYSRAEARAVWKLMRRRGLVEGPNPSEEQLNDPRFVDQLLSDARVLPSEHDWKELKALKRKIDPWTFDRAAKNFTFCAELLASFRESVPDKPPSEAQLRTVEELENTLSIRAPAECRQSWRAFESWVIANLPSDIDDICNEVECILNKRVNRQSLGGKVHALALWLALQRNRAAEIKRRARSMLIAGSDAYEVADALSIEVEEVMAVASELEEEGFELNYPML